MVKAAVRQTIWLVLVVVIVAAAAYAGLRTAAPHYASKAVSQESWLFVVPGHTAVADELLRLNPGVVADRSHQTTLELVATTTLRTLVLLGTVLGLATVVGVPLGVWAASHSKSWLARLALSSSVLGMAIPSFLAAFFLKLLVIEWYARTGGSILPTYGYGIDNHLILPTIALVAGPIAYVTRMTYLAMADVLAQDYVRTAHSKGLRQRVVMWRHALPNGAVTIIHTIGASLRVSLTSIPIIEFVFSWPGIGLTLLRSVLAKDVEVVVAGVVVFAVAFILLNWLIQVLCLLVHPSRARVV